MRRRLWLGLGRRLLPVPSVVWRRLIQRRAHQTKASLAFMTEEHHLVREFTVRELPRVGRPLSAGQIADELGLAGDQVMSILTDLEQHLTFLCRNDAGDVSWAYPVTSEATPHHVTFSSGEALYAA